VSEALRDLVSTAGSGAPADAQAGAAPPLHRVCVLADDPERASAWCQALCAEGLQVETADLGGIETTDAHALVLHCAHRLTDWLGTLRALRQADASRPLVVACVEPRELEQVLALEMGADDVIDAATSAPVVAARLRALWRRTAQAHLAAPDHLSFGCLSLHLRERRVQLGHERVELTECEFEVLWLLATQAGRAGSRAELLERLRGLPYQRIDRSIDCRIYRIRAKLHDGTAQRIRTVRNCGYLFSSARW